jgi:hypothetical protein
VDGAIYAGPSLIAGKLYVAGRVGAVGMGVFEIDAAGGTPKLLSDRGAMVVDALAGNAESLYWTESEATLSTGTDTLYRLSLATNTVEQLATLARSSGIDELMPAGGQLYLAGLVSVSYPLRRFVPGQDPVTVVANTTGAIAFTDDTAYYGSTSGLVKTPLDFSVTSAMSGTAGVQVSAVVVGPAHVWYASQGCICRAAR